jgi:hypothetical protein
MFNRMQEAEIRRLARQEAKRVLNEYLELRRKQKERREDEELQAAEEALNAAYGGLGQDY